MGITIGVLLFEDAEELDFVGPWEVFTMATLGRDDDRVVTIAADAEPVRCAKGMRVVPDHTFDDAPPLDVVVVPGGQGSRAAMQDEALLAWLRRAAEPCTWVTSVCTGSPVLYSAGLAKGARMTTHWGYLQAFRELVGDDATILERVRYVRDGRIVTAAGVSAGIDMALWVTGQLYGVDHARATQRMMEYDPAPPYSADV